MTTEVEVLLRCPVCGAAGEQTADGKSFFCHGVKRHCYDFSRSGYLNFSRDGKTGDAKAAVRARSMFLSAGYYQPLSDRVGEILAELGAATVLDAGCGEGYYTNRMAPGRTVLGIDLSRDGIDHAAKEAKRTGSGAGFAVCSLFEVPVADGCFDAVTNLFAPCAEEEFCRVLRDGGTLVLVGAGEEHLMGLKQALYDTPRTNPGRADLPTGMHLTHRERLRGEITVQGAEQIDALFSMTPYYWRTSETDRAKLNGLTSLATAYDFDILLYRKDSRI